MVFWRKKIKFSFLIPSKNRLEFLKLSIKSIIDSGYDNYEIIISDNNSSQNYKNYLNTISHSKIKYYRFSKSVPVTMNWNKALSMATGDYFLMLGDDDAITPDFFKNFFEAMKRFKNPDVIYIAGFHYCYPKAMQLAPYGYFCKLTPIIFRDVKKLHLLSKNNLNFYLKSIFNFKHYFNFNAQHFIVSKKFISKKYNLKNFYKGPYPDFYSSALYFNYAKKFVLQPKQSVIVGISPKSFGSYYFNNNSNNGYKFLGNNLTFLGIDKNLKDRILPGDMNNTNWFISLTKAFVDIGDFNHSVNYERYALSQFIFLLQKKYVELESIDLDYFYKKIVNFDFYNSFKIIEISFKSLTDVNKKGIIVNEFIKNINLTFDQYPPGYSESIDIGNHSSILDAINYLSKKKLLFNDSQFLHKLKFRVFNLPIMLYLFKIVKAKKISTFIKILLGKRNV